jgi:hypothetical protein
LPGEYLLATVTIATESPDDMGYAEKDADGKCSATWIERLFRRDALIPLVGTGLFEGNRRYKRQIRMT